MDGHVLLLVLAAALLHATWNSIVKGGSNKLFESSINALGGGLGALAILPFLPAPAPESWGLLALSCCFHLTYYICISQAYDKVDLSMGYTIMRGCAPMLTALGLLLLSLPAEPSRPWGSRPIRWPTDTVPGPAATESAIPAGSSSSTSSPSMPMCSGGTGTPTSAICGPARPRACSAACAAWAPTASPSGP